MPAAISAPNTQSSSTSVIGTEVTSARRKSELIDVVGGPVHAGLAGLGHPQARMRGLDGGDGALRGDDRLVGVVRVARRR